MAIEQVIDQYITSINRCDTSIVNRIWSHGDEVSFIAPSGYYATYHAIRDQLVVGGLWLLRSWRAYTPMYASEVTFTIRVNSSSTSDISGSSSYYDKSTAEQLSKTFPFLVQSDYFYTRLRQALGTDSINGTITADTVPDTNLFTLKVTSPDPKDALAILEAVIEVYPQAADYVVGSTTLTSSTGSSLLMRSLITLCV